MSTDNPTMGMGIITVLTFEDFLILLTAGIDCHRKKTDALELSAQIGRERGK